MTAFSHHFPQKSNKVLQFLRMKTSLPVGDAVDHRLCPLGRQAKAGNSAEMEIVQITFQGEGHTMAGGSQLHHSFCAVVRFYIGGRDARQMKQLVGSGAGCCDPPAKAESVPTPAPEGPVPATAGRTTELWRWRDGWEEAPGADSPEPEGYIPISLRRV